MAYTGSNDVKLPNLYSRANALATMETNKASATQNAERDKKFENAINAAIQEGVKNGWSCNFVRVEDISYDGKDYVDDIKKVLEPNYGWSAVFDYTYEMDGNSTTVPKKNSFKRLITGGLVFWDHKDEHGNEKKIYPTKSVTVYDTAYNPNTQTIELWYEILRGALTSKATVKGEIEKSIITMNAAINEEDLKSEFQKFKKYLDLLRLINKERLGVYPDDISITT